MLRSSLGRTRFSTVALTALTAAAMVGALLPGIAFGATPRPASRTVHHVTLDNFSGTTSPTPTSVQAQSPVRGGTLYLLKSALDFDYIDPQRTTPAKISPSSVRRSCAH